jgi:hypothetical protein
MFPIKAGLCPLVNSQRRCGTGAVAAAVADCVAVGDGQKQAETRGCCGVAAVRGIGKSASPLPTAAMIGHRLDRDNDLFSLAAHHLGPFLARLREWVLEARASQNRGRKPRNSSDILLVRTETFLTWARNVIIVDKQTSGG